MVIKLGKNCITNFTKRESFVRAVLLLIFLFYKTNSPYRILGTLPPGALSQDSCNLIKAILPWNQGYNIVDH